MILNKFLITKKYKFLVNVFSTKYGGFSNKPFEELNLATHVGDDLINVKKNIKSIENRLNIPTNSLIFMNQIHSNKIKIIKKTPKIIPKCDCLITKNKNLFLVVLSADCYPITIFDPKKNIVAAIHAGREGTKNEIVIKCIQKMQKKFHSKPKDLICSIGIGIDKLNYEVDLNSCKEFFQKSYSPFIIEATSNNKYFLDLKLANYFQLLECGVLECNIEINKSSTYSDTDYFSYRRDGETGRFGTIIGIRSH